MSIYFHKESVSIEFNEDLVSWFERFTKLKSLPIINNKTGIIIKKQEKILETRKSKNKIMYWKNIKYSLNLSIKSSDIIVKKIMTDSLQVR